MHAKCDVWLFLDKCAIVGNVFAVWMVYFCVFNRNRLPNMRAITTWMLFRGITSQCANRDLVEGNIFFFSTFVYDANKTFISQVETSLMFSLFSFQKSHVESVTSDAKWFYGLFIPMNCLFSQSIHLKIDFRCLFRFWKAVWSSANRVFSQQLQINLANQIFISNCQNVFIDFKLECSNGTTDICQLNWILFLFIRCTIWCECGWK